jgi:hypothetical protein
MEEERLLQNLLRGHTSKGGYGIQPLYPKISLRADE